MRTIAVLGICLLFISLLGGCAAAEQTAPVSAEDNGPLTPPAAVQGSEERLRVVATTTIVADVVHHVGGDRIDLTTLLPAGADPHSFEPTPQDAATIEAAHVVFVNGAGLETFLERLLQNVSPGVRVVSLSDGLALLAADVEHGHDEHEEQADEEQAHSDESGHSHEGADPHVWFDPHNVMVWADTIAQTLSALDPQGAETYRANAATYRARLAALDTWIEEQVAQVPQANRRLVTDHTVFTYFAARYGFEQVGALLPGYSTLSQSSAQELARVERAIQEQNVKAIFVGLTVNPSLAERVAQDTSVQLVFLYTGSLSGPDGPTPDYISMMEYNVRAIVAALR